MRINNLIVFAIFLCIAACKNKSDETSHYQIGGMWRGVLETPGGELPFNFSFSENNDVFDLMTIMNGEERIEIKEIEIAGDSIFIQMPVFDSEFRLKIDSDALHGFWFDHARPGNYKIPFTAKRNVSYRFTQGTDTVLADVTGNWKVTFSFSNQDSSDAIGIFSQENNRLTGTFRTPTGDYRFLAGEVQANNLYLSCFDGAHAFLFKAKILDDGTIIGDFWSGKHWHEDWLAVRNDSFELPDPDTLTYLREGYDKFDFSFPDLNENIVSFSDEKYKKKVAIIQIMGSWCPNCMDETKFLSNYYNELGGEDLNIIALAFEKAIVFENAKYNLERLIESFDIRYDILLAGSNSKSEAATKLPMLNHVLSYPTTIFIDKKGKVRRIHTGFDGPATGQLFKDFKREFITFVDELLDE